MNTASRFALRVAVVALLLPAAPAQTEGTHITGNWERGLQMISEDEEELAQEANIDSEFLFDRIKLGLSHPFGAGVIGTLDYIQENKDFRAYDTYDNLGRQINTALTFPLAAGLKLKLSNRVWWKDYTLRPNKDNISVVTGALLMYHPSASPWDFTLNYSFKELDYDNDPQQDFENHRAHSLIVTAARQMTEQLRVNVRARQKMYDFETKTGLILRTASIGFDYEF